MRIFCSALSLFTIVNSYAMHSIPISITEEAEKFIRNADKGDISYILDALDRDQTLLCAKDRMGYTALHRAILKNNQYIAITLISEIQDRYQDLDKQDLAQHPLNIQDFEGNTALHLAFAKGYTDLVEMLYQAQADISIANNKNITVAQLLIDKYELKQNNNNNSSSNSTINTIEVLDAGQNKIKLLTARNFEQELFKAVRENNISYIKEALEKGIDVNTQTTSQSTLLHKAVIEGHEALVHFLLDKGADPNKKNNYGFTPLRYAMGRYSGDSCESLITLLLNKGADHTILDNQGHTALSITQDYVNWLVTRGHVYALIGRRIDLLKNHIYLLEQAQTNPSKELLQEAIKNNFARIVRILLESGITLTNDDLTLAQQYNASDVLEVLKIILK